MQHYFVNCLAAFLLVVAIGFTGTANGITVFDVLSNTNTQDKPETVGQRVGSSNVEDSSLPAAEPKKTRRKIVFRKLVKVDLDHNEERIMLEEGDSFELKCSVKAHAQVHVQWVRGHNLKDEIEKIRKHSIALTFANTKETKAVSIESKYVIDCASSEDEGPLHCLAVTDDKVDVQTRFIDVVESNRASVDCSIEKDPVITKQANTIFAVIGSSILVPCEAEGFPRPEIQWLDINGTEIDNHYNPRYVVLPTGGLMIEDLVWSDMGSVMCLARGNDDTRSDFAETFIYPVKRG